MKILWIPHTAWHIPQRAHLFCHALAERHEVHATDWVADFSTLRSYLSRRYLRNFTYRRYRDGKVLIHGIPRCSPALFVPALRHINVAIYSGYVQRIVEENAIDVVVCAQGVSPPRAPRLIFDMVDDNPAYWLEYGRNSALACEVARMESAWIRVSDQVVTISTVLRDKVVKQFGRAATERVFVIPNGIDLRRYQSATGQHVRSTLGIGARKVVGLVSGLGEFSGVLRYLEAARMLRDKPITHLIVGGGSREREAKDFVSKHGLSNVMMVGQVSPAEVDQYYAALDVGVIPFDLSDFTHAACPIKLLEYLACGKQVVSTPLEEVKRMKLSGVTFVQPDANSLAQGLLHALHVPAPPQASLEIYDAAHLVMQYERILAA